MLKNILKLRSKVFSDHNYGVEVNDINEIKINSSKYIDGMLSIHSSNIDNSVLNRYAEKMNMKPRFKRITDHRYLMNIPIDLYLEFINDVIVLSKLPVDEYKDVYKYGSKVDILAHRIYANADILLSSFGNLEELYIDTIKYVVKIIIAITMDLFKSLSKEKIESYLLNTRETLQKIVARYKVNGLIPNDILDINDVVVNVYVKDVNISQYKKDGLVMYPVTIVINTTNEHYADMLSKLSLLFITKKLQNHALMGIDESSDKICVSPKHCHAIRYHIKLVNKDSKRTISKGMVKL